MEETNKPTSNTHYGQSSSLEKVLVRHKVDLNALKRFDLYARVDKDNTVSTTSGAFLSLIGWMMIVILLLSETNNYFALQTTEHLVVDKSLGRKLQVNMNISFHSLTCAEVHMDAMDVAGDNQVDVEHDMVKRRLSSSGLVIGTLSSKVGTPSKEEMKAAAALPPLPPDYCGSCFAADNRVGGKLCCNTCEELRAVYRTLGLSFQSIVRNATQCMRDFHNPWAIVKPGEGCRIEGRMSLNKVAGNFHMSLGDSIIRDGRHIHQFLPQEAPTFNVTHTIHSLSFGEFHEDLPNGPLDSVERIVTPTLGTGLYQYFIKVIPTELTYEWSNSVITNTFVATERFRPISTKKGIDAMVLPGVFFIYDISPFEVQIARKSVPFLHFITRLFAVVGGVFATLGALDFAIYRMGLFETGGGGGIDTYKSNRQVN